MHRDFMDVQNTGVVTVLDALDRESTPSFALTLVVQDGGTPSLSVSRNTIVFFLRVPQA
jgi:hypothetical protein